jgi:hypothetical protein
MGGMRQVPILAAVGGSVLVVGAVAVALTAGGPDSRGGSRHAAHVVVARPRAGSLSGALPIRRRELAVDLERAYAVIADRSSTPGELAQAGLVQELATRVLESQPARVRRATLTALGAQAAAGTRANLDAAAQLSSISTPQRTFPRWRIVRPPAPRTLLGYFRAAQSRFGVRWENLAAIEFIETRFGRVDGLSPAGARGPMQFMAATWARYGSGEIDNPRDAILSAARFLRANGARRDLPNALYHYNNSPAYVRAALDYAGRMRADPRAFYGYYYWPVVYTRAGRAFILPAAYPRARPVAIAPARR